MQAKTLMVQGTTSDAGKSAVVTGLCRYFYRTGHKVVPFKPQNMALNSAVTVDGGEIGRAQAVQARACGLPAHTDMNPILLKPNSDKTAQVIIHGQARITMKAGEYHLYKTTAMHAVLASHQRLLENYQTIIVEGAGSPAEINLREGDIANMGFAEKVNCPVVLVADIDRGGVFAHIVGTLELLSKTEQQRVIGFVINRFRGDMAILQPGIDWLEMRTGKPVLGVLPYLHDLFLEAEDAVTVVQPVSNQAFRIIVPRLPRISNHTDFDALRMHQGVSLEFVSSALESGAADLMILPGSKSVRADLAWLKQQGWEQAIQRHLRYGGKLIGICAGFQMLGQRIHDPAGIEGEPGSSTGFSFLDMQTTLQPQKKLQRVTGRLCFNDESVNGYEIHAGITTGRAILKPLVKFSDADDGAISDDGQVAGTYVHGLFDQPEACNAVLDWAGCNSKDAIDFDALREKGINLMADTIHENMDVQRLESILDSWVDDQVVRVRPDHN